MDSRGVSVILVTNDTEQIWAGRVPEAVAIDAIGVCEMGRNAEVVETVFKVIWTTLMCVLLVMVGLFIWLCKCSCC